MMEFVALHHEGYLFAPHSGRFQSRSVSGEAFLAMEAADARGGPAALLKKRLMPHDVPSTGLSPDMPLLDLRTNRSDYPMPNGVVLATWRTMRKIIHLQTQPKDVQLHPANATPHSQDAS
jgi:hypothetical protein